MSGDFADRYLTDWAITTRELRGPLLALHTVLALTFICLLLESDQGAIAR